jgi:hypothetical protein
VTFPHVIAAHAEAPPRPLRKFKYRVYDEGAWHEIEAHDIYFYEAGRIGFWNDIADGERVLILATKAFDVRQVVGHPNQSLTTTKENQ